ncbi:MAG TPA: PAS domain S-box protein [Anaerolineae bacterium]|nr:PAS domain S-box protein [Anaerolineae bacterium]
MNRPSHPPYSTTNKAFPLRIVALYLFVGGLWILVSDQLLSLLTGSLVVTNALQAVKGLFFVLITASMLYGLISRNTRAFQRMARSLEESREQYRQLIEQAADGILVIDSHGDCLDANQAGCTLLGYGRDEILRLNLRDLVAAESQADALLRLNELRSGDTRVFEQSLRGKDGRRLPTEISARRLDDGRLQAILRDASGRKQAEDTLRQNEERLRLLTENARHLIYRYRLWPTSGFEYISPAATTLIGYTPEELYANPDLGYKLIYPDDQPILELLEQEATTLDRPITLRVIRKDGSVVWAEVHNRLIYAEAGQVQAIEGIARDVTERQQRERELQAIATVSAALRSASTRAEILPIVLDVLPPLVDTQGTAFALGDPATGEMVVELAVGLMARVTGTRLAPDAGVSGQVIASGETFVAADLRRVPALLWPDFDESYAAACAPLMAEQHTMGVLWAIRRKAFTPAEVRLLETIADMAATAIHRAGLHEQTLHRAKQLEAVNALGRALAETLDLSEIYERLYAATCQLIRESAAVFISLFDGAQQLIVCAYGRQDGQPVNVSDLPPIPLGAPGRGTQSRVIHSRESLIVNDLAAQMQGARIKVLVGAEFAEVTRSALYVPMLAIGEVIGVVQVQSYTPKRFRPEDAELLSLVANTAAIAIQNARLFEAERAHRALAEALRDTAAALNGTLHFDEVLDRILTNIGQVVPHDAANIMLIESDTARIARAHGYAERGTNEWILSVQLPLTRTPSLTYMMETGGTLVIADTQAHPDWLRWPEVTWIRSYVGAPIAIKGKVVGFLNLDSTMPGFFTPAHAGRLQAFADQAAIAIENTQLYNQISHHAEALEVRVAERTAELTRERRRIQAILDAAAEGVVFTDPQGTIQYINPAMEQLTGYTAAEVIDRNPRLWGSGQTPHTVFEQLWGAIKQGQAWQGEVVNRRKDGTQYNAAISVAPLSDGHGQIVGYVGIQHDITHQKEVDRLKDQFVSNVSHELRTPLANIKLYLNLLEHGKPDKRAQYLLTLHRETGRLEHLIEDLLSLSRLDLGAIPMTLVTADLNPLIAQLVSDRTSLAADRGLLLDAQLDPELPRALVNTTMITQVVSNLMGNAMNYTPSGGAITLITSVRRHAAREWITFTVQDTGFGVSAEEVPHLFERFYRGAASISSGVPGTGLGLAICKSIVDKMEGRITVDSQPGQGAAFTVWLKPAS